MDTISTDIPAIETSHQPGGKDRRADERFWVGVACLSMLSTAVFLAVLPLVAILVPGWRPVTIVSGSMEPSIARGDVLLVTEPPEDLLGPGTVVVFEDPARDGLVTHRVVRVDENGNYVTKGDANEGADSTPVPPDQVVGVGRVLVPLAGYPAVWAGEGAWLQLLLTAVALGAIGYGTKYALLAQYDPWRSSGHDATADEAGDSIHVAVGDDDTDITLPGTAAAAIDGTAMLSIVPAETVRVGIGRDAP
jgi:signal peptidase I